MSRRTLIVMVKEPRPGRVKTRLARGIGKVGAAWWYRHQVRDLLRRIADPRWRIVLAVSPDVEGMQSRVWPAHLARWPQGPGNLGDRMARLMREAGGPVCLIGSDIPGLTRRNIAAAFGRLGAADAVFGPATDGGYWLVGLRHAGRFPRQMFDGVRWSGPHALADSIAALGTDRIAMAGLLTDVDDADDLAMTRRQARAT